MVGECGVAGQKRLKTNVSINVVQPQVAKRTSWCLPGE